MEAQLTWLDDPEVFEVNRLPAHSDHHYYGNKEEMQAGKSSFVQCLDGTWQFAYAPNAKSRLEGFYAIDYDASNFGSITVPSHIELSDYDQIHYINTMYPWEGHVFRRPKLENTPEGIGLFSEAEYNPVGMYRHDFDLEESLVGKSVSICFEGVEQAMYVWCNGHFVGYGEDSFTPTAFDLTPFIREKGNVLCVEVHKRSSAAYLEDQDFFRFFGIFRSVKLYATPALHIADLFIQPVLELDNQSGTLSIATKMCTNGLTGELKFSLHDATGKEVLKGSQPIAGAMCFEAMQLTDIIAWSHANPYLYQLVLEVYDQNERLVEIVPYAVGFRRVEMKDKVMLLNGEPLRILGVNRHEWSARNGRVITREEMEWDRDCILRNEMNAVRTSHYPNNLLWYEMCDEAGLYVMAEVNLESHGSWQKSGAIEPSWNLPGSDSRWLAVVLDRAKTQFELLKNHPSILWWSLGNESFAEDNIAAMHAYYKEVDSSRLVHYEGVFHNRSYEDRISDMESRMYAKPYEVAQYLENEPKKPFILCEFMHNMGNSLGGLGEYMELFDRYPMYQGGFIWDYIDQAILVKDEVTGQEVIRYGGDFDDRPSDYEFSGNGVVFATREEKPALQEVKYYYGKYK